MSTADFLEIDEDDPTYDDHSAFTFTHYIPYQNQAAPLAIAATVHHLIAFINKENGGSWDARDYPQAVAHFYNGGPSTLTGEILQNPPNGIEKVARIDRLTKIINLE